MRPLKIVITGFCSYSARTEIDFEKFGTAGLYLITGNTGSGKTTIFDAITFALYGEPSGQNRQVSMLRSSFATPDEPTEVELTFQLGKDIYEIKRNPTYERRAKRGEGTTVETANVELKLPDGKILEGSKVVDKKITEILGIDRSQFCQIVMLAQGDFQKLLTEDTGTRLGIFRKLFKTDNYQLLQKKLTDSRIALGKEVSQVSASLKQFFDGTLCDENSVLSLELNKAKTTESSWEEKIQLLEKIIIEDENLKRELEKEQTKNQKILDEINLKISDIAKAREDKAELKKTQEIIKTQSDILENLQLTLQSLKADFEKNGEKEQKAALLKQDLPKYDELEIKQKEVSENSESLSALELKITDKTKSLEKQMHSLKLMETEAAELKKSGDKRTELSLKEKTLENLETGITELETVFKVYENKEILLKKAQEEYKKLRDKAELAEKDYQEKNRAYLDGQAGILAEQLKENKPCPVCGSLTHPSPAEKTLFVPTEDELNEAKTEASKASSEAVEKSQKAAALNAEFNEKKEALEKGIKLYFPDLISDGEIKIEEIKDAIEKKNGELVLEKIEIRKELEKEEEKAEKIQELEKQLPEENRMKEEISLEISRLNLEITAIKTKLIEQKKNVEEIKSTLKFENKLAVSQMIENLEQEIKKTTVLYEETQNEFSNKDKALSELKAKGLELEKRSSLVQVEDEEKILSQKTEVEAIVRTLTEKNQKVYSRINVNRTALQNIKPNSENLIKNQKQYMMVNELVNTATGNIGQGKAKVQLETYVQMHYFDRIIAHANRRFLIMSGGQYELVRKKTADNAQSQTGLELNVIDHYRGTERDVRSLSGGESFEASLSLALGLSDEIAENAGGIRIDTMFVDEGFGTLDADTLQKAYKALVGITEGNRLVGIISHVDYLKEKIDHQLIVKKEADAGSSVTIKL